MEYCLRISAILSPKVWFAVGKGNNYVKTLLTGEGVEPTAVAKWNTMFVNLPWEKIFSHCFSVSSDVQLRWFQTRLLHRLLPTQTYLYKCKISDDPMCNFCQREEQTICHLFAECTFAQEFWRDVRVNVIEKCQHAVNFLIDKELILFGVRNNVTSDNVMDSIILYAKFFIYRCKMSGKLPTFQAFVPFLKHKYDIQKYSAAVNSQSTKFKKSWLPYQFLFE